MTVMERLANSVVVPVVVLDKVEDAVPLAKAMAAGGVDTEIPHVQGKRNPSKMVGVARGHQKADTLKPYSQKTSQSNHTRTTALSNSMK